MSKSTVTSRAVLLLVILGPGAAVAQPQAPGVTGLYSDPLDEARAMAKARFEADQATSAELAQQRVEAARLARKAHLQHFRASRPGGAFFFVIESSLRLLQAELARNEDSASGSLHEPNWRDAWLVETITQAHYEQGKTELAQLLETRSNRLEIQTTRSGRKNAGRQMGALADFRYADDVLGYAQQVARYNFAAEQTSATDLAVERLRTAREALRLRTQESTTRPLWIWLLSDRTRDVLRAEFALRGEDATAAVLEQTCRQAWRVEAITQKRHADGRDGPTAILEARNVRLEAQLALARLRGPIPVNSGFATDVLVTGEDDALARVRGLDEDALTRLGRLARQKFAAEQLTQEETALAWREVARQHLDSHYRDVQNGRFTVWRLDDFLDSAAALARAELAVRGEAGRAVILEAHWRQVWALDHYNQLSVEVGRNGPVEGHLSRIHRLVVEMELARLRERKPEK